jgi:hypothetical protein
MKFNMNKIPYWQVLAIAPLLYVLGTASNQAVLIANGGKFPVMLNSRQQQAEVAKQEALQSLFTADDKPNVPAPNPDGMIDDIHCVMSKSNHLKFLADYLSLGDGWYSPGDLLIIGGYKLWLYAPLVWLVLILRKLWS